ncbi:MAG: beta-galactosidase, partial [Anaerolineae bacterium]|nr:beta-galactosidase [Anaerolineae bacterium]
MSRINVPRLAFLSGKITRRFAPAALRLAVIFYLIGFLAPAPPRVEPEAQQTVQTEHPILCVHSRLTDEVEDWKIQKTYQLVREMGATTIVEFFPWAYIETDRDYYDWNHPDRLIEMARQEGLTVIARLGIVPAWARPDPIKQPTTLNYLAPEFYDEYAEFVGKFAARYRDSVRLIVPWNEPNLMFEWGDRQVTPEEYVRFLKLVHDSAHTANPDVI